ncbi:MAG: ABC-2 transporter permease [Eubacteriales bacterium]
MNRILNAAKLDFYAARSSLMLSALMFILAIAIGAATKQPMITMVLVMVFATYSGGTVFSTHEKNHGDKLYGILPLKKTEMIAGRYLYALVISIPSIVIAGVLGRAIAGILNITVDSATFWIALALAFVYYCFSVGVSYPIYFKFTFAKAYIFTMLPLYLVVLAVMLITRKSNYLNNLSQFINFFNNRTYLAPILGIVGGLLLLVVSMWISNLIYKRKEI